MFNKMIKRLNANYKIENKEPSNFLSYFKALI